MNRSTEIKLQRAKIAVEEVQDHFLDVVVDAAGKGATISEIATVLQISDSQVRRYVEGTGTPWGRWRLPIYANSNSRST